MRLEGKALGFTYSRSDVWRAGKPVDGDRGWLFRGVDLSLAPGETVGLAGPSGCGKTTLARLLAGYALPVEGSVTLGGKPLPTSGHHPVQLVLQHPERAVNPRWRLRRTLTEGWPPGAELLRTLGVEPAWLDRWPAELSGGELQRICIARALGPGTRFLIADEMTTMLDAITQAQIWSAVADIARRRALGVLVISHERSLLHRVCDRVLRWEEIAARD